MGNDDSKTKGPRGSITFKKEPEGLTPLSPKETPADSEGDSLPRIEPVFKIDLEPVEPSYAQLEESQPAVDLGQLQAELHALQPQVDDISRTSGSVSTNQVEVLRKYIALKEAESRDLKEQQRQYQTYVKKLTSQVQSLSGKSQDLVAELETLRRRDESSRLEGREIEKRYREELVRQKNEYEDRIRRSGNVSQEYQDLQRKREEWKDKVRDDLKRIKLRERELENKYELLKRDTQALLDSKDRHVLELKRKNDAFELEMESLEDRLRAAGQTVAQIQSKKRRLIETLKLAIALLEEMDQGADTADEQKAG